MLLNGWKEISGYLKCDLRTAQRWHRDSHLPVIRSRTSRPAITADSAKLDQWLKLRASQAGLATRTSGLLKNSLRVGHDFLWTELSTGREFLKLAASASNDRARARRLKVARTAYDTLQRLLTRSVAMSQEELKQFKAGLREFRRELQKLGERV